MAEFGGSKAWSIQSSPLIYHLLLSQSFCRGQSEGLVGGGRSCWAEGLFFLSYSAVSEHCWWEGQGGENHRAFFSILLSNPTHTPRVLGLGKPVALTMRWKVDSSTITSVTKNQEQQKTPEFPSCTLAENHTVFPSAFQLCRSSANTTGIKGERVSSRPLLLLLCSTWLPLRSEWNTLLQVGKRLSVKAAAS